MNSLFIISPWSVINSTLVRLKDNVTDLPRLTRSVWTSLAVARGAKAGALALVLVASATTARADVPSAASIPPVDHYVHLKFLPKASELAQDAKMNNLTILRIDELADRVIVSYKYPDGRTATLGYTLLGTQVEPAAPQPVAVTSSANVSTARYTVANRDPEVVYVSRPSTTTVYYSDPYYYNAWAPWTVGFGIGWSTAYYGNYYRPYYGYHGGGHYHGGGYKHGGHGGYHGGHGGSHGGNYHSSGGYGRGGNAGYSGGRGGGGSSSGSHGGGGRGRR